MEMPMHPRAVTRNQFLPVLLLVLVGVEGLEKLILRKSSSRGSGYFGVVDGE